MFIINLIIGLCPLNYFTYQCSLFYPTLRASPIIVIIKNILFTLLVPFVGCHATFVSLSGITFKHDLVERTCLHRAHRCTDGEQTICIMFYLSVSGRYNPSFGFGYYEEACTFPRLLTLNQSHNENHPWFQNNAAYIPRPPT